MLRGALGVAEQALEAARAELAPGISEQSLTGAMMEAMAAGGVTTPATQDGAWITPKDHSWRRDSSRGRVADGDLVAFAAGALADGYVGEVGRTWPVGDVPGADALFRRSNELWAAAHCRVPAGRPRQPTCWRRTRRPASRCPPMPVAHGLGLGFDPPVISADLPTTCAEERLEPGHGAGGHRLRVAKPASERCSPARRRADHRRRRRGADVEPPFGAVEATA